MPKDQVVGGRSSWPARCSTLRARHEWVVACIPMPLVAHHDLVADPAGPAPVLSVAGHRGNVGVKKKIPVLRGDGPPS
jgi:hypothetical protein